jgi:tripartite-type tricarboxylate transporter receptor subunit TctC
MSMRARITGLIALLGCVALTSAPASAQTYPTRPIRLVVGFPPGGGIDFTARTIAQYMAEGLGQPIVVENKPGAAGVSAASEVARAAPDGYTLILANIGPFALAPAMMAKPPYDPVRDFTAIEQIVSTYFVAAVPVDLPVKNMREFVMVAGIRMTHVPYKGSAPALTDLMAGQTHILIDVGAVLTPQVKAGKLKALAVTSSERDPQLPDVPTMREAGYVELETAGWQGLLGPAGMPKDIVTRLSVELNKVLARADVRQKFADAGTPVTLRGPEDFSAFIRAENQRWLPVIKASGAKIE